MAFGVIIFATLVVCAFYAFIKSIIVISPGQRVIVWKRFGGNAGRVKVLDAGTHFLNILEWAVFGQGPFQGLIKTFPKYSCPVPLSTVFIDPDRVEIMSSDHVPGTANVAVELQVLEWSATEVIGVNISFRSRASITINQWVSNQLSSIDAAKLSSYAEVVTRLNNPVAIKLLNEQLKDLFLEAKRISVDPSGIALHHEYSNTVGKTIEKSRLITLQRLEAQAAEEAMEKRLKLQQMETQVNCEAIRLRSEVDRVIEKSKAEALAARVQALISAGLTPVQVSNIVVSEVSVTGLSKAEKVYVGMPQGLIGLRGAEHIYPRQDNLSGSEIFEKV